jgi:hypothetical protein
MATTELVKMEPEFIQELSNQGDSLPKRIRSQVQYQFVQSALKWFVEQRKEIRKKYAPFKRSQLDSLNLLRQGEKDDLAKCEPYEALCQKLIQGWEQEREAKAQKELQVAQQKALQEAQQERDRQLAQLESEKAETVNEGDKTVLANVQQTLESQPLAVAFTPVKEPYKRPQGHSTHNYYRAEVVHLKMLIEAVASGDADLQCLQPNMTYLNARARQEKEQLTIPGVAPTKDRKTVIHS